MTYGWLAGDLPYTAEGLDKKAEELKYSRLFLWCDTTSHLFENSVSQRYIYIIALLRGWGEILLYLSWLMEDIFSVWKSIISCYWHHGLQSGLYKWESNPMYLFFIYAFPLSWQLHTSSIYLRKEESPWRTL